ncbi:phenylalanine--tRNA ligase beta subunit-related protein [Limosilactobacillus reuteri]|uniref:phenylalanine--tRNA ligase beta subunit-related protein n=1 Tax=Limosilactobacillus reuteri TaxID=1598 RepID=UPI001CDD2A52|nr:phenylalanine--tRNA ligase beta subunit-related protein [Limosilactobacillus reuteri]MCH5384917.1 hypothetical protein [Limosilactobacillus reuteri]
MDNASTDIMMRLAQPETDEFIPLGKGKDDVEIPDEGEVVYTVGNEVRTRQWTWRQSDKGKITPDTTSVFFPIDGFVDVNKDAVDRAVADLSAQLEELFNVKVQSGIVDQAHPSFTWG